MGDAVAIVALAEAPQADLVEVVQADGTGDGVDKNGIGHGKGDNIGQVEVEEVGTAKDGFIGEVSDANEEHKDPGEQVEQGSQDAMRVDGSRAPTGERRV